MKITTDTLPTMATALETFDRLLGNLEQRLNQRYPDCPCRWHERDAIQARETVRQKVSTGTNAPGDAIAALAATLEPLYQHEQKESESLIAQRQRKTDAYIERGIPKEYREPIVRSLLPNRRAFDEVQGWFQRYRDSWENGGDFDCLDARGIIAVGMTGQAKTRTLARLVIRGFTDRRLGGENEWSIDEGHSFLFLPTTQLKRLATIYAGRPGSEKWERAEAEQVIASARTCDVLLLDDLSQPKFTPAYAETLYEIIEHRTSHRLLNLVSLQLGRDEFLDKVSDGNPQLLTTAEAIFRRLADYCDTIDFDDAEGTYDHAKWLALWIGGE